MNNEKELDKGECGKCIHFLRLPMDPERGWCRILPEMTTYPLTYQRYTPRKALRYWQAYKLLASMDRNNTTCFKPSMVAAEKFRGQT